MAKQALHMPPCLNFSSGYCDNFIFQEGFQRLIILCHVMRSIKIIGLKTSNEVPPPLSTSIYCFVKLSPLPHILT